MPIRPWPYNITSPYRTLCRRAANSYACLTDGQRCPRHSVRFCHLHTPGGRVVAAGSTQEDEHSRSRTSLWRIQLKGLPLRFGLLTALAVSLSPATLAAQDAPRTLTGVVVDRQHEPLRGAIVQVQNQALTGSVVSYITGPDGAYIFKRLNPDTDYSVWATYRGHRSRTKTLSQFDTKTTRAITLVIKLH